MEALLWIAGTALLIALPLYYPRWRLRRVLAQPLSASAQATMARYLPVYRRMGFREVGLLHGFVRPAPGPAAG